MRIAFLPIDDDVMPGCPQWPHGFGLAPRPQVIAAVERISGILNGIGLRGVSGKVVAPIVISSDVYEITAWAIGIAGAACMMPTTDERIHLGDQDDEQEWMVFRIIDGVAYHFETEQDLEASVAEACKAIITSRIERRPAPALAAH